jgi:hypothetical protein
MPIELTFVQLEISLDKFSDQPATLALPSRAWWSLSQVVLACLLVPYLVGCIQDFQRVRDLRAEPSPSSKVIITKREAWDLIHTRHARPKHTGLAATVPSSRHEDDQPFRDAAAEDARLAMMDF